MFTPRTETHSPTRRRGLVTGVALTAALGATVLFPSVATAATGAPGHGATVEAVPGPLMNYAINATTANRGQTLKVERAVEAAGGTVIESYAEIGVVIAQSDNAAFADAVATEKAVLSVGATRTAEVLPSDPTFGVGNPLAHGESGKHPSKNAEKTTKDAGVEETVDAVADPREGEQWDMAVIRADAAHQVTDGSRDVLVAVLDSGIQADHPDLAANVDAGASASCLSGVPDASYDAWQPTTSWHGTHVAGTIAAARNGVGITGVAPNVRLSSVKVVNDDGFIYPEAAICGFMFATATGADVTNNSYYIDPWEFWCDNDADQAAVKTAVDRAVQYSQEHGVLNVAAAGNENTDLANKTVDASSPDDTVPVTRPIDATCLDLPAELDGVVTVASTTSTGAKSGFSNYGLGVIDIAAPGSSILSTISGSGYGRASGTSMASPHVAGVAALLKSAHPELAGLGLADVLYEQANDVPCPADAAQCTGTADDNGFFGEGLVDALEAVS